jgi:spermidine/putrescine transport system substrate-binding protein
MSHFRRRELLKTLAAGALAGSGLLAGCGANRSRSLHVMGWADYLSPGNVAAWQAATNATLTFDAYASNDEMYSKLRLARAGSGYDLGMNTDFMIPLLIRNGLIGKLDRKRLPSIGNLHAALAGLDFDPGNQYTIPKCWGSQGFVYDRTVIRRPMATWGDFLAAAREEASGKVSLLDEPLAIAPFFWEKGISWNTTNKNALADARAAATAFAPHVRLFSSYPVQEIASHSVALAQCWNGNARRALDAAKDPDLQFVYAGPISEYWIDSFHLPAGSLNGGLAHDFLEFFLQPKTAAEEIRFTGFQAPVTGADQFLAAAITADPLIYTPPEVLARAERTVRNDTYEERVQILAALKAAAAAA